MVQAQEVSNDVSLLYVERQGLSLGSFGELGSWGGVDGDGMGVGERVRELAQLQKCLGVALSTISRCEYSFSFCCVVG